MGKFDDMFTKAEEERIAAAKAAAAHAKAQSLAPQANHGPELLQAPDCHCCEKPECEHETMIQCEFCGQMYPPNAKHECANCGEPAAPQNDEQASLAALRNITKRAKAAVRAYGDDATSDFFAERMIDLARAIAEYEKR